MDAALLSSILYGSEGWLTASLDNVNTQYLSCIKTLLGVRPSTPNDLCLIESGYLTLSGLIKDIQFKFFTKMMRQRADMNDDPFMFVWELAKDARTPCARYVNKLLENENPVAAERDKLTQRVEGSERTKPKLYKTSMNPELDVHEVYSEKSNIPEYQRVAFTRLRLGSHNLMIERGRWSRIPTEDRKCVCGAVQTEQHVLGECPLSQDTRIASQIDSFHIPDLFAKDSKDVCKFCYDILKLY